MNSMEVSSPTESTNTFATRIEGDPLLVLDVGGQIFKCHRSTLLNSGSHYFSNRFGGSFDAKAAYRDPNGLDVYFVERSGELFEYVFRYIVSLQLNLPDFHKNPVLWRNLRAEALYFGLESLYELLRITYVVTPNANNSSHQGILYWLGTRRGTTDYTNPFSMGACYVGGWVDDSANQDEYLFGLAGGQYSRKSFVQYRAEPKNMDFSEHLALLTTVPIGSSCRLLDCDHGGKRLPAVLDLKAIQVRPTHFSLRASLCLGMDGDWNLEASEDGVTWDVLHASRNEETKLRLRGERANGKAAMRYVQRVFLEELELHQINNKEAMDVLVSFLEREQRSTWAISSPHNNFYRYFRIIGADEIGVGGVRTVDIILHSKMELCSDTNRVGC